ncbi:L-lysine N6-monooxygenase MbtG OS=Streptomyces tendae OX=1932 GN=GUR47_05980 PE=3 SV=1 [Streptomyces tendae]
MVNATARAATSPRRRWRRGDRPPGGLRNSSHGITSSLLSNTAVRVGEILESLLDRGAESASDETRTVADGTGTGAR